MSPKAAGLAVKNGYSNVKVYLAGEPAWAKAGQPTYASADFVEKGNIVLVDLRSVSDSESARLPRTVSIPFDTLEDRVDDLPKKAPIVLYSDREKEAIKALALLRSEGFRKVSLVYGPLGSWLETDGKHISGPVVTEITWKRKLEPGEVSVADFEEAASGKIADVVILDVRTNDETKDGKFANAMAIPLDTIASRASELPKGKKIYAYCSTGARAEMAFRELKKKGFDAYYLVANVDCDADGCALEE